MWITAYDDKQKHNIYKGVIGFSKKFDADENVKRATLFVSSLGIFDWTFNEKRSDDYFMPGWSDYKKNVCICDYDVTPFIKKKNLIEVFVAPGWYSGRLGYIAKSGVYGKITAVYVKIEIEYADGKNVCLETDEKWNAFETPVSFADFFDGEKVNFNKRKFKKYSVRQFIGAPEIRKNTVPPVRAIERLAPVLLKKDENGAVFDFGKNIAGVVVFSAKGRRSDEITVTFGEVVDKNGDVYTENLRSAKATDSVKLGEGICEFNPKFTYHGFRYARVNCDKNCELIDLYALVLSEDIARTGFFKSENELADKIYGNILNGQRANFISIPVDCPQRDERIGWTGDAQIFCDTAFYNADCAAFFKNYINILEQSCTADGRVPVFVPFFAKERPETTAAPAWSDAITILPVRHYAFYGDKSVIESALPEAKGWVDYFLRAEKSGFLKRNIFNYGDWLSVGETTDKEVVCRCYLGISILNLVKMYLITERAEQTAFYAAEYDRIKRKFRRTLFKNGIVRGDTQTAYLLSYASGFLTKDEIKGGLKNAIKRCGGHLSTGFLGLRFLLPTLCEIGESETAYDILLQTEYPSWGYEIRNGATTIWERWNGIKENGEFFEPSMNSFNHYSLGSAGYWYYAYVLGIKVETDGVTISPYFTDKLGRVEGYYIYRGNKISVSWQKKREAYVYRIETDLPLDMKFEFNGFVSSRKKIGEQGFEFEVIDNKKT